MSMNGPKFSKSDRTMKAFSFVERNKVYKLLSCVYLSDWCELGQTFFLESFEPEPFSGELKIHRRLLNSDHTVSSRNRDLPLICTPREKHE